jgi:gas vesicle protein
MNKNSKTILAVFAGLAAGTIIGILFAPEKGKYTRENLANSVKDLQNKIKEKTSSEMDQFTQFTEKVADNIKSKMQHSSNDGQENS